MRTRVRILAAVSTSLATVALAATPGWAVTEAHRPGPVLRGSVADVSVTGGNVHAVLTFPATSGTGRVSVAGLRATFGMSTGGPVAVDPVTRAHRTALLAVDTSGSMAGAQLAAARAAARRFLAVVPADVAVGLLSFADRPQLLVAPTTRRAAVAQGLDRLVASGRTSLYDAVTMAVHAVGSRGSRTVILLSDGGDTNSTGALASALARVRSSGVRLTAVGFQTSTSQYAVLRRLAAAGHDSLTRAADPAALRTAFDSAARRIASQVRITTPVPNGLGGLQRFKVSGSVDGRPFAAGTDLALPEGVAPTARVAQGPTATSSRSEHPAVRSGTVAWAGGAAVFGGLFVLALLAVSPLLAGSARQRLRSLDAYGHRAVRAMPEAEGLVQGAAGVLLRIARAWGRSHEKSTRTALLLERADMPFRLDEWHVLRIIFAFVPALLGGLLLKGSTGGVMIGALLGLLLGAGVPSVVLRFLAGRRARKFEMQLPDVLTLMATSLTTGFSLPQAIDAIVRDASEPTAKEFARALAETRIGADLEDALERTAIRMDSVNLSWTNMAVRIQRQVGGSLADTLRTTAATLRERESLRRQVRALSAEGRLSAYILIGLPVFLGGYLYVTNRSYLALLWQRPLGLAMLTFAVISLVIGSFWMRRVVTVEV